MNSRSQAAFTGLNYIFFRDGETAKVVTRGNTINFTGQNCGENTLVIQ